MQIITHSLSLTDKHANNKKLNFTFHFNTAAVTVKFDKVTKTSMEVCGGQWNLSPCRAKGWKISLEWSSYMCQHKTTQVYKHTITASAKHRPKSQTAMLCMTLLCNDPTKFKLDQAWTYQESTTGSFHFLTPMSLNKAKTIQLSINAYTAL